MLRIHEALKINKSFIISIIVHEAVLLIIYLFIYLSILVHIYIYLSTMLCMSWTMQPVFWFFVFWFYSSVWWFKSYCLWGFILKIYLCYCCLFIKCLISANFQDRRFNYIWEQKPKFQLKITIYDAEKNHWCFTICFPIHPNEMGLNGFVISMFKIINIFLC